MTLEEEIRKNPENQDWSWYSTNLVLSEDFVREFKDYVDWRAISLHQPQLSPEFVLEMYHYMPKEDRRQYLINYFEFQRELEDMRKNENCTH